MVDRQKPPLDPGSQLQIMFESTLLGAGEVIEAEPHERIGDHPLSFNRLETRLADPERSVFQTGERVIGFTQEAPEIRCVSGTSDLELHRLASIEQLFANRGLVSNLGHERISSNLHYLDS